MLEFSGEGINKADAGFGLVEQAKKSKRDDTDLTWSLDCTQSLFAKKDAKLNSPPVLKFVVSSAKTSQTIVVEIILTYHCYHRAAQGQTPRVNVTLMDQLLSRANDE